MNRTGFKTRIKEHHYDFILYTLYKPRIGWVLPFWDLVQQHYAKHEILLMDAQDAVDWWCIGGRRRFCSRAMERNAMIHKYQEHGVLFRTEPG